jgi:hypothetical protein
VGDEGEGGPNEAADTGAIRYTPTDPSLEFDVFEMVRVRLARALMRRGHGEVDAERAALYVVEGLRPASRLLKTLTGVSPPGDDEIEEALAALLGEAAALEKAKVLILGGEGATPSGPA